MPRLAFVAILLSATSAATTIYAAKPLPEKTTQEAFSALIQKAAGKIRNVKAEAERPFGTGFSAEAGSTLSIGLSERTNNGQSADEIMAAIRKYNDGGCKKHTATAIARQTLDGMTIIRTGADCFAFDENVYGEDLVIVDAARYQHWGGGGEVKEKAATEQILTNISGALVAMYR